MKIVSVWGSQLEKYSLNFHQQYQHWDTNRRELWPKWKTCNVHYTIDDLDETCLIIYMHKKRTNFQPKKNTEKKLKSDWIFRCMTFDMRQALWINNHRTIMSATYICMTGNVVQILPRFLMNIHFENVCAQQLNGFPPFRRIQMSFDQHWNHQYSYF